MKKRKKFLIVIAVIAAIAAALAWWQYDNIKSVYYSYKYDNTDIDKLIEKQNDEVDKYIRDQGKYTVRSSTKSEEQLHHVGLIDDNEFVDILTGETSVGQMFGTEITIDENKNFIDSSGTTVSKEQLESAKGENTTPSNPQPENPVQNGNASSQDGNKPAQNDKKPTIEDKSSKCIAQMYVLKSSFTSRLDGLYNEAKEYYISMSAEDRKNAKKELLDKFYSQATALEAECDAKVDSILSELDSVLTESGGDKSIIEKIREAYVKEKSLKKAYYLNLIK